MGTIKGAWTVTEVTFTLCFGDMINLSCYTLKFQLLFRALNRSSNSVRLSSGQTALPLLQHARQGDGAHQVFPRFLLRMSEDALRHPAEEVPQVQLCLRSQRLSPHLHHLSRIETEDWEEKTVDRTKGVERVEEKQRNWRFTQRGRHFGGYQWSVNPCFNLFEKTCFTTSLPFGDQTDSVVLVVNKHSCLSTQWCSYMLSCSALLSLLFSPMFKIFSFNKPGTLTFFFFFFLMYWKTWRCGWSSQRVSF